MLRSVAPEFVPGQQWMHDKSNNPGWEVKWKSGKKIRFLNVAATKAQQQDRWTKLMPL